MISQTELILNPDGSVYHLNLHPQQIAATIFLVGDPGRVEKVSQRFDSIEEKVSKREFNTHTGRLGDHRVSVVSTGIGTDNIDIVINELDALVNMDFQTRMPKKDPVSLRLIRLGTSGALQEDIEPDSLICSGYGAGFDNLLQFYQESFVEEDSTMQSLHAFFQAENLPVIPYIRTADPALMQQFAPTLEKGITLTAPGFYGPQGRSLRAQSWKNGFLDKLSHFRNENFRITNLEMETSAIYGLSKLLNHQALSLNVILANRLRGAFSKNPAAAVDKLITFALDSL